MKTLFIPAKSDIEIKLPKNVLEKLPEKIGLVTTIQHLHKLNDVKRQFKKAHIGGQILGCDTGLAEKISNKVDAFLYIGTGKFHPMEVYRKTKKNVFIYNPISKTLSKVDKKEIERMEKRKKGALLKFLSAKEIGVLVSTKSGQRNMKAVEILKKKYKEKNFYIFLFNTLDFNELENFNFVEVWVNTACPRIIDDWEKFNMPVTNFDELL